MQTHVDFSIPGWVLLIWCRYVQDFLADLTLLCFNARGPFHSLGAGFQDL